MAIDAQIAADQLLTSLRSAGTPERAASEKRYLKSDLEHLGVRVPDSRRVVREFVNRHRDLTHDELVGLVRELSSWPIFESRFVAALLLNGCPQLLGPADLGLLHELIGDSNTSASVTRASCTTGWRPGSTEHRGSRSARRSSTWLLSTARSCWRPTRSDEGAPRGALDNQSLLSATARLR